MTKPALTTIILTKNNQDIIKKCIKSAKKIKNNQIMVVDDYSDDKTREIAKKEGAEVVKRKIRGNFAAQRNFALKKSKTDWVFFLDSDEIISPPLSREIVRRLKKNKKEGVKGLYFKRQDFFLGRPLKHGETANIKLLRLAQKTNKNKWRGRVHEEWQVAGKTKTLKHPLLHHPHKNISQTSF